MHSLHHKSYNPGPWSGLSMHPVEHLLYYGCMMVPALWIPQHPFAVLYNRVHLVTPPPPRPLRQPCRPRRPCGD